MKHLENFFQEHYDSPSVGQIRRIERIEKRRNELREIDRRCMSVK